MNTTAPLPAVLLTTFAALATFHQPATAQDSRPSRQPDTYQQSIQSGPKKGMQLTKVEVYAPSGPRKGETFDAAAALGQGPGALLFMHTIVREVAPIIRTLDAMNLDYGLLGFQAFTIRLGEDRTQIENHMRTVSQALRMRNPIVVSTDGAEGPGNYALNRKATLTLVLVKNGVVHRSIAFTETGQKDVPMLRKAVEEVTGPLPKTRDELMKLLPDDPAKLKAWLLEYRDEVGRLQRQLQNQRGRGRGRAARGRRGMENPRGRGEGRGRGERPASRPAAGGLPGKIPDDPELQGLMRSMVSKLNTNDDVDDLFTSVDKRVGDDDELRQAAVEGFRRLLATTYGTDYARKQWQAYIDKHDKAGDAGKAGNTGKKKKKF